MYWAIWENRAIQLIEVAPGEIARMKEQFTTDVRSVPTCFATGEGVWPLPYEDGTCKVLKEISPEEI